MRLPETVLTSAREKSWKSVRHSIVVHGDCCDCLIREQSARSYTLVSVPGATGACTPTPDIDCGSVTAPANPSTVVNISGLFPLVNASWAWAPDSLTSEWISLTPGNTLSGGNLYSEPAGTYVYETSFVLPKDFTSAQLSGIWSTDNLGSAVTLNGNPGSGVAPTGDNPFPTGSFSFTNSDFVVGTNHLDFTVYNIPQDIGNPEGLRVEVTGTYVPEPGFYGVLALGLTGLVAALRRHRVA